jgi:hypothetical protein
MKTYSQLKESIGDSLPNVYHTKTGPTNQEPTLNLSDTVGSLDRINVALKNLTKLPTADPMQMLINVSTALAHAGISFKHTEHELEVGTPVQFNAQKYGGRVGMTPEDGYVNDDGFGEHPHVVTVLVDKRTDGLYDFSAEVTPV